METLLMDIATQFGIPGSMAAALYFIIRRETERFLGKRGNFCEKG